MRNGYLTSYVLKMLETIEDSEASCMCFRSYKKKNIWLDENVGNNLDIRGKGVKYPSKEVLKDKKQEEGLSPSSL